MAGGAGEGAGKRLGRGLDALLAVRDLARPAAATVPAAGAGASGAAAPAVPAPVESAGAVAGRGQGIERLAIASIRPNPVQPRKTFREQELAELAASLRVSGLLQPVTVRPAPDGDGYQLIAGERRLRAATSLGWTEIPAVVREVDDQTLLTLAIVENLQRSDLDPMDEAEGYERLIREYALTQQQVAELVGKDRSTVANALRLLGLPDQVKQWVREGVLSAGHGRALLSAGVPSRVQSLASQAVSAGWSVRETERRARAPMAGGAPGRPARSPSAPADRATPGGSGASAEARRIEGLLRGALQTDVSLVETGRDRGEVRIAFYGHDDLVRVLERLGIDLDA